jgi:hypothetical protein
MGGFCVQTTLPDTPTLWHFSYFSFYDLFVWVFFTGAGMDIIFKDLEAETIHVCIAWALLNIFGLFFIALLPSTFLIFYCFSVHGIWGLVNNASLPLVCGWLGLVAKPWDGSCFCLKSISLGVSRGLRV